VRVAVGVEVLVGVGGVKLVFVHVAVFFGGPEGAVFVMGGGSGRVAVAPSVGVGVIPEVGVG
jgi:hypothetical protein